MIVDEFKRSIVRFRTCSDECEDYIRSDRDVWTYVLHDVMIGCAVFPSRFEIGAHCCVYGPPSVLFAKCGTCCGGLSHIDYLVETGQVICKTADSPFLCHQLIEDVRHSYMPWLVTRNLSNSVDLDSMFDNDVHDYAIVQISKTRRQDEQQQSVPSQVQRCKYTITNMWNMDLISAINDMIVLLSDDE